MQKHFDSGQRDAWMVIAGAMRTNVTIAWAAAVLPILLFSIACDKEEKKKELIGNVVGDAATAPASSLPPREAGAAQPAASVPMPERPIPKGQTMVSSSAPEETQMKAIAYMVAMRAPHQDDAPADAKYAADLVEKLKPIALGMDKGGDKAKWNRVEMVGQGREIAIYLSDGCDPKAPANAVVTRANLPLPTLLSHGILVIRCNDQKQQCLQSVRDPDDVLCTTAPRHK
jgi:hypothetical protein